MNSVLSLHADAHRAAVVAFGPRPGAPFAVPTDDTPLDSDTAMVDVHPPARRICNQVVAIAALTVYAAYLVYRALFTLNMSAPVFSLGLLAAEIHGWIALCFHFVQLWRPVRRATPQPPSALTVDVFITTYNEDVSLLRQTIRGALAMRGPHETYVLDDGRRPEVRALCEELGCRYLTRHDRAHAKAGNWNNAFRQTNGDLIVSLDADHVPRPEFLERTLGFFRDPRVWLVQTPQEFHNIDSVQHQVNWESRRLGAEHETFFKLILSGKDRWNSAFFCGTNAVLRRAALAPHGGLITGCITEDIHTSVVLHGEGWKSIYVNETLATGLAPHDVGTFLKQRLRWAEGNLKIIRLVNPLTYPGLSLAQRINYSASVFFWTAGVPKFIYYLAPPVMLFSGIYPTINFDATFMTVYTAFFVTLLASFKLISGRYGRLIQAELFGILNCFIMLQAFWRLLADGRREGVFVVTSKRGGDARDGQYVAPHLILLAICIYGFVWGAMTLRYEVSDDVVGHAIAMFWCLCNAAFIVAVLRLAMRQPQRRFSTRFRAAFVVTGHVPYRRDAVPVGITSDISEGGCRLLWPVEVAAGTMMRLELHVGSRSLPLHGEVTACGAASGGYVPLSVKWVNVTERDIDVMNDAIFDVAVPDVFNRLATPPRLVAGYRRLKRRISARWQPRNLRRHVVLPVRIVNGDRSVWVTTRDISATGMRVIGTEQITPATTVRVDVHAPAGVCRSSATVAWLSRVSLPGRVDTLWAMGMRLETSIELTQLKQLEMAEAAA